MMTKQITSLTSEQAQRAILLFYDLLPHELWEDQTKPSVARMETLADRLQEKVPADIQPFLNSLRTEGDATRKGEVAKVLLGSFSQRESLHPYVEQAISRSAEPHMAPIPLDIGTILIVMAVLSLEINAEGKGWKIHLKGRAPELVDKFADFVKALPRTLLDGLK